MSYGLKSTESCVETKKSLKRRIQETQQKLDNFIEVCNTIDIDYSSFRESVGGLYLDIDAMQKRLKDWK